MKGQFAMHPLSCILEKESRLVIGIMSGTSADGIDAALVRIHGHGADTRAEELSFVSLPFTDEVRSRILHMAGGGAVDAAEFCRLKTLLGILYADACEAVCLKAGYDKASVDLVGCHGQTVWHIPQREEYCGRTFASTLQIGEEAEIAERMGCPVAGDFRVRDVAAGGQGAPLVPYTDYLLYGEKDACVALQNIGGIGNITIIPPGAKPEDVVAFDTGPGNMIMDAVVSRITGGRLSYDPGGEMAAKGTVNRRILERMMSDEYISRPLPKTTGREHFGPAYVDALFAMAEECGCDGTDLLATANVFTAESISCGITRFSPVRPSKLITGGGGSHNLTLLRNLRDLLPDCRVLTCEDMGFSSDAKEAVAFAILANETAFADCGNMVNVTGASHGVVMGKLSL